VFRLLLIGSLLATLVWGQAAPAPEQKKVAAADEVQNIHTPDDPGILRETQLGVEVNGRSGLIWWIPFEFWLDAAVKNGTPAEKARKNLSAPQGSADVGVFLAKVSMLGAFDYISSAELQKNTFLRDSDRPDYAAISDVTGDAKDLADIMKPMLANVMGRASENFAMIFFPANGRSGKPTASAIPKGNSPGYLRIRTRIGDNFPLANASN
jgi:hypothetical protein